MAPAVRKTLVFLLKLGVSAASLFIIFSKAETGKIISLLTGMGLPPLLTASGIYLVALMVSTARWKLLLPERFTFRRLFSLYLIGSFFGRFLPGMIGGDAVRAYYLNKDARKIGLTLASIFMDRYLGYVSLMTIGLAVTPFAFRFFGESPFRFVIPVVFVAFMFGSILFFRLRLGGRLRGLADFYGYLSSLRTRKDAVVKALLLSFIIQGLNFLMVVVLAWGIGVEIPILVLSVFLPIVITITSLPISISGLGVREGSFVILLGMIGIRPEAATSISLAWFLSFLVGSLPGVVMYFVQSRPARES